MSKFVGLTMSVTLSFQTPEQYYAETGVMSVESRRVKLKSLNDLLNVGVLSDYPL